ncbi:MAG TPA: hypothetical protein VHA71_10705 [Rhodanobacteraceae bacterium]|jgi:hypothetical protein|nr:hypothetical protein [Rhodanobacteraceae bacterium]
MSRTTNTVQCATHGVQPEAFVCGHILWGLQNKVRVGFFTACDPGNPHPDAWCTEYNGRLSACGNKWVGAAAEQLDAIDKADQAAYVSGVKKHFAGAVFAPEDLDRYCMIKGVVGPC